MFLVVTCGALRKGHTSVRRSVWRHASAQRGSQLGKLVALPYVTFRSLRLAVVGLVES